MFIRFGMIAGVVMVTEIGMAIVRETALAGMVDVQAIVRAGMAIIARVQAIGMVTGAIIITAMAIAAIMMGGGTLWQRLVLARL